MNIRSVLVEPINTSILNTQIVQEQRRMFQEQDSRLVALEIQRNQVKFDTVGGYVFE